MTRRAKGDCGIYQIFSPGGCSYIGSSANMPNRIRRHVIELRAGAHDNCILQAAWDHYQGHLQWWPLLCCASHDLKLCEQICFDTYKPEYNLTLRVKRQASPWWLQ